MAEDKYLKKLESIKSKINNAPQISNTPKKQEPTNKALERIKKEAGYGFTWDDVKAWESSVNDVLKRANEYLSTDSYRVADRNIESEIKKLINDTDSVSNFLHSNGKYIEDYEKVFDSVGNTQNALSAYLNGVRSMNDVFSQYANEDDYNKAVIGWLNEKADVDEESASARLDYYNSNVSKAEEIDDSLPWYGNSSWIPNFAEDWFLSDEEEALRDEIERIEAENNQYERTQYGIDSNYIPITDEVTNIASNRNFTNASMDELWKYDAVVKDIKARNLVYDYDGNRVDAGGRVIYEANHPVVKAMRENNLDSFYDSVVGDKLGMYLSASQDDLDMAYERLINGGNADDTWAILMNEGETKAWKELTSDEITRYYYKLNTEGKSAAYKYLKDMSPILTRRATKKRAKELGNATWYEQILNNIASVPMSLVGSVVGTLGDFANLISGNELDPYDAAHALSNDASAIRQDTAQDIDEALGGASIPWLDFSVGDAYSAMMSIGDSVVSSFIPGGSVLLGLGAAQSTMKDIYDRGGSAGQMLASGIMAGVAESFFEKYSIGELNKIKNMDKASVKGLVDVFVRGTIMGGVEASEEMATEIVNTLTDSIVMGSQSNWTTAEDFLKNVLNAGIGGFLSGGATGSGATMVKYIDNKIDDSKVGKDINNIGMTDKLLTEAGTLKDSGKLVDKYLDKYAKKGKLSNMEAYRLLEITENAKVKSAIETELKNRGEKGDVSAIADAVVKQARGNKLSKKEQALIDGSVSAKERTPLEQNASAVTENAPIKENATEAKFEGATDNAITIIKDGTQTSANPRKISSLDSGDMKIELDDGDVVSIDDIARDDNTGMGIVYHAAHEMASRVGGFNIDTVNTFVKGFNPGANVSAAEYIHGFSDAYRFGKMGYPVTELDSGVYTSRLSKELRETAYNFGKAFGNDEVAKKSEKIASTSAINANKDAKKASKKGKVHFDGSVSGKALTERQKASLKGLRVIAEAMGIDIHIFESKVVDGERQGANGWYDPSDNSIHIDLYAGVTGDSLMLFTAAHELTHHIREVAPTKFKIFADALLEEYAKHGHSIEALIKKKLESLEANGRLKGKTEAEAYDLAYEEVVADSAEAMLVDSNAIEALSRKIQAKDKGLWETIKDFITKLVGRIKAAYEGLSPDSAEANYVRDMTISAEKLQKLWVDALLEASEVNTVLGGNGIIVNSKTDSATIMSVRDVLTDADRKKVSKALAERFGVTQEEAVDWLKAETSLASLILNPKYSQYLDYTADSNEEAIKSNSDYPQGTVDFSNICKKRRDFTEVMNRVLRNFPNHVFAPTDLAKIRTIMEEEGMEVACAICYVEDRRQLDGPVAQDFIDSLSIYREGGKIRPDGKPFNANQLKAFKLIDGDSYTPSIYELISLKGRNSLKAKNPAMEEAWVKFNNARGMQSVRLLLNDAEYKRQILKYSKSTVDRKNDLGGLRIYSFSDMEMFHLIDIIQVITDSATVGLSLQGYTKVNEYAKAVKDTGEKLNRSLIPKGDLGYHIENGRVVLDYDTIEGIDINHPDFFDNIDNPNIGNIVIGINATQIKAAMTSKFIDQIIPFHTGQSNEVLGEKGIAAWDNYKDFQSERDVKTKKKSSHQINIYTEVINAAEAEGHPITNKVEFVNKFLEVCKENNLIPRFSDFLDVNENGEYIYTEGYHKFLVDFKTFDQKTGEYLPQMPVRPIFDNDYITNLLRNYVKSQKVKDAELAKSMPKVIERITNEIVKPSEAKYSDRDSSYIDAVNRGDMETAQKMVDEAAKKEGYTVKGLHATNAEFTVFDIDKTSGDNFHGKGIYFTNSVRDVENNYENYEGPDPWQKIEGRAYELAYDKYGISYEDTLTSDSEIIDKLNECYDIAIEEFKKSGRRITAYLRFDNPLILEKGMQIPYDYSGYDGIIDKQVYENIGHSGMDENTIHYVVFNPSNIKSADPVTYDDNGNIIPLSERFNTKNSDIRYSDRNPYSYEAITSKPDMKLTMVSGNVPNNRADIIAEAKKNAVKVGKFNPKNGSVSVRVEDVGVDVILGKDGLKHSLDRRMSENAPVVVKAGEIISNSIRINELNPRKAEVDESYVLIGAAYDANEELYIVRSVVNRLSNVLTTMDVLYAISEKKENRLRSMRPRFQHLVTDSTISIAQLLDFVNIYFPDILPESVLRHFGHTERPAGALGKSALYQDRNPDSFSNRSLLANALETAVQNEVEAKKLEEYKANIDKMNAEQAKLNDLRAQIKEISFSKGKRDTEKLKALQDEATKTANRITLYDGKLLELEATKALKDVLEREKLKAYRRAAQKGRERLHENVEGRRKTEARHKIINVTRDLDALLNRGTKDKNVKIDLRDLVSSALDISDRLFATDDELLLSGIKTDTTAAEKDAIAEYLNLYSEYHSYDDAVSENKGKRKELRSVMNELKKEFSGVLERERNRINETQAKTAYDALLTALKTLKGSDVSYISAAIENVHEVFEHIETLKEKIGTKLVKDMTLEELNSLYKALKSVKHLVSNANKMFGAERNESLQELSVKAHEEVSKNEQKKYITAIEDSMSKMSWNNLKPIYLMERLKSKTLVKLFADVLEGESQWARDVQDAHDYIEEQKKKYNYKDWDFKKLHEFTSNTGQTYELSLEQMLSIYAYVKRGEDALEHLRNGGFVFGKIKRKKKGGIVEYYLNDKTAYKVPDTVIFEIIGNPINAEKGILTDEQKAYVDAMQEYLSSTMGAKGNEVSRQLYGIDLFTEENYLPMRSEKDFIEKARMQDEGKIKIKNKGFTKPLQKGSNNPIVLEDFTDSWGAHVAEMSSYHAMTLPLENLGRVLNYQNKTSEFVDKESLRTAIGNAFGDAAKKAVDQMIDDINGGARVDPRETGVVKKAISLHKKAKVMLSLSVAIQQPTSILRAMALIDPKHFVGTPKFSNKHWNEIKQYAPVAIIKEMGHFDTGMGQSSSDWITGKSTWRDTVDNISSWLPERADMITWIGIWNAVKRETASKNPAMNTNSKEFLELAGKRFEEIIRYTQVYDSTLSRSSNMRSKSGWMQMATSFLAEPTTSLNMREAALRSGNKKRIARTTAAIYSAALLNAILVALPYAMRDDDEDETFLEKYASSVASSFWGNINPIAALPFFRDIWSISLGYDVERTDMSLASDFLDSFEGMLREITKEETDSAAITDAVLKLLGDVSAMLGIPVGNLYREAKAIANTIGNASNEAESTLESVLDELYEMFQNEVPIWSKFPGETRGDKLYDAILEGDDVYVERLEGYYKDKNAVNSAIRKALREHDPRINEAAIALNNGERLEYNSIIDEIVGEGFFEEANVMSAILQEYEAMQPKEEKEESTEEKEQSRYEVIWVLEDILNSDITEANAMKDEIIQTHIENGKSQREAENAFKSSFRTEVKNYYLEDRVDSSTALKLLMQHAGNTEEEALNKIQYWNFKKQYTDSALDESQVTKYYETIDKLDKSISSVLSVSEYEEALDKLAEATGVDLNGDGKTDKDTLKKDIVSIIDSMPFTKEQKDALYYIKYPKGNIRKDTPWR
jgi:hypothetical protein